MKNCSGINCPMQYGVVDSATCPAVECCPNATPPLTNYDRIVRKTPEELAVWLAQQEYRRPGFDGWLPLCNHVMGAKVCHAHGCEACWLDWLRQEAT